MLRRKLKSDQPRKFDVPGERTADVAPILLPEEGRPVLGANDGSNNVLERAVFGGEELFTENLEKCIKAEDGEDSSSSDEGPSEQKIQRFNENTTQPKVETKKPVWVDEDDAVEVPVSGRAQKLAKLTSYGHDAIRDGRQFNKKLRDHFEKCATFATPKWADLSCKTKRRHKNFSDDESEDEEDLLRRTGSYIVKSTNLPKQTLQFKRLCDVTSSYRIKATIKATEFHKNAQVLLVAGYTQRLMLFQVDGAENPLLHSVHFDRFPIETSHFSADGEKVFVGSAMHENFYTYDMHADKTTKVAKIRRLNNQRMGRFIVSPDGRLLAFKGPCGSIQLLSATTCDFISTLKMNGNVRSTCFSSNGDKLYSHGDDGKVYIWDVGSRQCVHTFFDEGCIVGTSLAISHDDNYIACGSNSGVVNIYSTPEAFSSPNPKPLKTLTNLTTPVDNSLFNPNGELLLNSSSEKENAVRLFHSLSRTTFENFPYKSERLGNIQSADFSPNGGFLCCGNDSGQAFLYRLYHYDDY